MPRTATMFSPADYETLKVQGTSNDRLKYVFSLTDKTGVEEYLKKTVSSSADDLRMFLFVCRWTTNTTSVLDIFRTDALPVKQRVDAAFAWIDMEKDPSRVEQFIIDTITDIHMPR